MPRNRRNVPHDDRRAALLDAAECSYLSRGHEETSLAAVARDLDLTANAVRWYYPTSDALLAAVLHRLLDRGLGEVDAQGLAPVDRLLAVLRRVEPYRSLQALVHARAQHSADVAAFHDRFHAVLEQQLLPAALDGLLPHDEPDRALALEVVSSVLEGAYVHPDRARTLEQLLRYTLDVVGRRGSTHSS